MSEPKYKTFRDLRSASKEAAKIEEKLTPPTSTSTSSISRRTRVSSTPSIAPERDFQRVPNSVTREAMPQGLFRGKSKQVYDYLYHQTRGALTPTRSIRKSRKEILKGSGLGSMVTVDAAVDHLRAVKLLAVRPAIGSLNGNEYEVFTPEEAATRSPSTSSTSSTTSPTQKVDNLDIPESGSTSITQPVESSAIYDSPKTSFKTIGKNFDDEAAPLPALREVERELTGKNTSLVNWKELDDLLATELKIAAARTGAVSNVPAFLTEHLRRRLFKRSKEEMQGKGGEGAESPVRAQPNASACPDCGGSGWWYPEGSERGVAKCTHLKLEPVRPEK